MAGFPFVFIRMSGCNLRCIYCDTKYAWEGGEDLAVSQVMDRVSYFGAKRVMITGGEPLVQKDDTVSLARELLSRGYEVFLETNGSIPINGLPLGVRIVMDIKTPASGSYGSFLWDNLDMLKEGDEVNVVIVNRDDYQWAKSEVLPRCKGFLVNFSPAWGFLSPSSLAGWILEDRLPVRLNLQIHKFIWGEGRGR